MKVNEARLAGVKLVEPTVFGDSRGFFMESWNARSYAEAGIAGPFVQDNHSRSARGVLRGLHYQLPNAQGKLIRITAGAVFDVVVDLRRSSATFGQWEGFELSGDNKRQLWIPPGFAHGFLSLKDGTELQYKCTGYYSPPDEHSLIWNDPAIGIDWPLGGTEPLLSAKDRVGVPLSIAETYP